MSHHDATARPPASPAPGPAPSPAADTAQPTTPVPPWALVVMIGGAAVLIGSFLPFASPSQEAIDAGIDAAASEAEGARDLFDFGAPEADVEVARALLGGVSWNAWSSALSLFPLSVLVVLYAVIAAGQLALARFTSSTLPDRIAGFTWPDLRLLFGTLATLTMIGYFARDWQGGMDREIGMYIMTLGAIGLLVGAVMEYKQSGRSASPRRQVGARRPTQGDIAIMIAGGAILLGSFLTVLTVDEGETVSAWGQGLFPLYVVPAALGAAMAAQVALTTFGTARIPDRILGLGWNKVHLAFGLHAALMMLGFLVGTFGITILGESTLEPDKSMGFWIMLVASLGLAAGAILHNREPAAAPHAATPDPAPPPTGPAATAPPPRPAERLEGPRPAPPSPSARLDGPGFEPPPPQPATPASPGEPDQDPAPVEPPTPRPVAPADAPPTVVADRPVAPQPAADEAGRVTEPETAFCPHCGAEVRPADRFCAACGKERTDHA